MAIKESDFILDLHDRVGSVRDDEFGDLEARKALRESLRVYTRWLPQIVLDSIITVKDQQLYPLDIPELINLIDVYWLPEGVFDLGNPFSFFNQFGHSSSFGFIIDSSISRPSAWLTFQQEVKRRRKYSGAGFRFANFNELYLIPTPCKDDLEVFFEYERQHTISTVHAGHMDVLLDLGEWYAKKVIAEKRRKLGSITRGGSISADTGRVDNMIRESKEAKMRAEEQLTLLKMRTDF